MKRIECDKCGASSRLDHANYWFHIQGSDTDVGVQVEYDFCNLCGMELIASLSEANRS